MLSREDNELLTRVGPGTPMGEYVRRFWIPVALSAELPEPDGDPRRVRLLGQDLVLFRDTKGRVGLIDEHCPHRLASLYFGRNEECGIRCIYHGWKFDVSGACVDMPSEPPTSNFKHKIRATAYPTRERGGLIWGYLGPPETIGDFPAFEWLDLPPSHLYASRWQTECNFVQAMEGEMDTSHVGFLHSRVDRLAEDKMQLTGAFFHEDRAPKFHIERTAYGMVAAGRRDVEGDKSFWRMNQLLLPFYSMIPPVPGNALLTRAWYRAMTKRAGSFVSATDPTGRSTMMSSRAGVRALTPTARSCPAPPGRAFIATKITCRTGGCSAPSPSLASRACETKMHASPKVRVPSSTAPASISAPPTLP